MSVRTLAQGQIRGLRCPYCPTVCQRLDDRANALSGLEAHMRLLHTELYEQWVATFRGTNGTHQDDPDT